ncbi:MAG: 30S ribosomal protein S3ae [Thermoprotei archaeon]|nr:MAG: 30S ribosomal protein S3ae [Thermoprotei archaeon]RLF18119.1 MAG: 30S ribosomal protein S3ae [Thermoprotei archaeon]
MSQRSRRGVKKPVAKATYKILASSAFGHAEIGHTMASSPENLIGRTIWVTLYSLTNDPSQQHIKLLFQIVKVEGDTAYTVFKGHDLARDYLRSLVRRGASRVDGIFDVTTKDGYRMRVMVLAITLKRAQTSQEKAIRKIMGQTVEQKAQQLNFDELVQEIVLGKVASEVFNAARKIYPLRRVEVRKSKVLKLAAPLIAG